MVLVYAAAALWLRFMRIEELVMNGVDVAFKRRKTRTNDR
jgi:hypothetical protein